MLRLALNLLAVLFIGFGFLACDAYDAAVKDQKRDTSVSSGGTTGGTTSDVITVSPAGQGFSVNGSQVFTASGGTGAFAWTLSGQTNSFTGAGIDSFTPTSATVVFTIPTALEGVQTITITAMDNNGAAGSTTFTLSPPAT